MIRTVAPLLFLAACADATDRIPLHFDGPVAAAVLPADAGPWDIPTGYVANSRSGTIVPLDLKMGRLLTDDPTASFLRSAALTTGHARLLSDVAVVAGEDQSVTVWATDSAFERLLRVPYVLSVDEDGWPVEVEATATEPVFVDADGSGDSPSLADLTVRTGFTTTESWSIEYDGARWWAKGSRSGTMAKEPHVGEDYLSDNGELGFTLTGTATSGDRFDFITDTGVTEYDLGGFPTALLAVDGLVYVSVAATPGRIDVWDGVSGDYVGATVLDADSQPGRMSAASDGRLFVADAVLPVVWTLRFDQEPDPAAVPVESIALDVPAVDVAWQGGHDRDEAPFDHLFVAPLAGQRVDVWDLETSTWVDPNTFTQDTRGVFLGAPVTGLSASVGLVSLPHETAWGARPNASVVSVATADGFVYMLEGSTGCAVMDYAGPYASPSDSSYSYIYLDDQGADSSSTLWVDEATGYQVVPSSCGGVVRSETWTVTYDAATLSWTVEGTLSGVQQARAREGERYLSDDGAISFVIASGALPATQGDNFTFATQDGLRVFRGSDENEDGVASPAWESPGRPVSFETYSGPTGGGWDPVDRRQYALLPVINTDIAARLFLDAGKAEVLWE